MEGFTYKPYGQEILDLFGLSEENLLGCGRTSRVYGLDMLNVVRVYKPGTPVEYIERLSSVLNAIDSSDVSFRVPRIEYSDSFGEMHYSVEDRLGLTLEDVLPNLEEIECADLIADHVLKMVEFKKLRLDVEAANLPTKKFFGEINGFDPLRRETWSQYILDRAAVRLEVSKPLLAPDFDELDQLIAVWTKSVEALADPEPEMVHGDWSIVNMTVTRQNTVDAVIDFHEGAMLGDAQLDVAMAYTDIELWSVTQDIVDFNCTQIRNSVEIDPHRFWIYTVLRSFDFARRKNVNDVIYQFALKYAKQALASFDGTKFTGLPQVFAPKSRS